MKIMNQFVKLCLFNFLRHTRHRRRGNTREWKGLLRPKFHNFREKEFISQLS